MFVISGKLEAVGEKRVGKKKNGRNKVSGSWTGLSVVWSGALDPEIEYTALCLGV